MVNFVQPFGSQIPVRTPIKVTYCIGDDDVQAVQLLDCAPDQLHTVLHNTGVLFGGMGVSADN